MELAGDPVQMCPSPRWNDRRWKGFFRWIKFSAVGAIGILVQSAVLLILVRIAGANYMLATAIAVEAAIIHNFGWHHRWTWVDRTRPEGLPEGARVSTVVMTLIRFNLTTGAMSITGNLLCMRVLVARAGLGVLRANLTAIALCSLVNFVVSDRFVFVRRIRRAVPRR